MDRRRIEVRQRDYAQWALLIPIALLLLLVLLNPVPLVGGYTDDYRYLVGAQCLDCLPANHWERRFAIVWPVGVALKLFGENLWSVMLFPVASAIAAVVLTFLLVEKQYGRKAALIACCVLVLTPVFSDRAMRIGIDMIELVFLLGSVLVLQRGKGHFWAGALMGLAVLCRPTMFAALPMVAFLAWWQDSKSLKRFAIGFVAPLAIEALAYLIVAGDPLYPWKLSLNHMAAWRASMDDFRLAQFISRGVDTSQIPLFNPALIGAWRPAAGVEAHWTVQGIVNLLVSPECALTLCAGLIFALLAWKTLDRLQLALILSACLFFGALTYAFAVDPRPRIFLPIIVVAAALVGSIAPKLWVWPRKLVVVTFFTAILLVGAVKAATRIDYRPDAEKADKLLALQPYAVTSDARQRLALIRQQFAAGGRDLIDIDDRCPPRQQGRWLALRDQNLCIYSDWSYARDHRRIQMILSPVPQWIAAHSGEIEADADTRHDLGPLEAARGLPGLESNRPYLLLYGTNSCRAWMARSGLPNGSVSIAEEALVSRTPFLGNEWSGSVCLFRYGKPLPASEVQAAILRARADPRYRLEPRTAFMPRNDGLFGSLRVCR
jgi:4-amino-4-deoxy-L-arabinose transferase-like glycosyltransferase